MLTQVEADILIAMQKTFSELVTITLPAGTDQTHELIGADKKERFLLDLSRGTIRLSKVKFQTRGRIAIVLVRLDVDGVLIQIQTEATLAEPISTCTVKDSTISGLIQ
jgi:hypothetical protein